MNKVTHSIYIGVMMAIVLFVLVYLSYTGYSYYILPLDERFFHPQYRWFKPSGVFGHGLGIIGTLMIILGVGLYIARKQYGFLERWIRIKYLLEFHIFLCTLGPILVMFHTTFKFGGIASISLWSMVAVVASGVIGRFIYNQIPHNIDGKALGSDQLLEMHNNMMSDLIKMDILSQQEADDLINKKHVLSEIINSRALLKNKAISKAQRRQVMDVLRKERALHKRIRNLKRMKMLFKYWHVAHKPFAIIMLVIAIIHVGVTLTLGYRWIF